METWEKEFYTKQQIELDSAIAERSKLVAELAAYDESIRQKDKSERNFIYYTSEITKQETKRERLIREANTIYEAAVVRAERSRDEAIRKANSDCDGTIATFNGYIAQNAPKLPAEPANIILKRGKLLDVEGVIKSKQSYFDKLANMKEPTITIIPAKTWIPSPELQEKEKELAELRRQARLGLLDP